MFSAKGSYDWVKVIQSLCGKHMPHVREETSRGLQCRGLVDCCSVGAWSLETQCEARDAERKKVPQNLQLPLQCLGIQIWNCHFWFLIFLNPLRSQPAVSKLAGLFWLESSAQLSLIFHWEPKANQGTIQFLWETSTPPRLAPRGTGPYRNQKCSCFLLKCCSPPPLPLPSRLPLPQAWLVSEPNSWAQATTEKVHGGNIFSSRLLRKKTVSLLTYQASGPHHTRGPLSPWMVLHTAWSLVFLAS